MFLSSPFRQAPLWPRLAVIAAAAALALWGAGNGGDQTGATPHPAGYAGHLLPQGEKDSRRESSTKGDARPLSPCGRGPTRADWPERGEGSDDLGGCTPAPSAAVRRAPFPGPYVATLVRIVDGDTFETRVRIWFGEEIVTLVRIRGIDAPELHARCDAERRGAEAAREALGRLLAGHEIELSDVAPDKYFGRVVADVWAADDAGALDVATTMRDAGLARPYDGHRRASWCETASAG